MNELKIMILTVTKCSPKDKDPYTRIDYLALDNARKSDNIKGHTLAVTFMNGHSAYDKITSAYMNKEITAVVEYVPSVYNPMKPQAKITTLKNKDETISLL